MLNILRRYFKQCTENVLFPGKLRGGGGGDPSPGSATEIYASCIQVVGGFIISRRRDFVLNVVRAGILCCVRFGLMFGMDFYF